MVMIVISSALGNTAGVALMVFTRALRGVWASSYMRVMYRREADVYYEAKECL